MAAERTVRELTNFGFAEQKVREALTHIGDPGDKEAAINWLLDQGEEDCGGTVELKHCHHVDDLGFHKLIKRADMLYGQPCKHGCNGTENWLCLHCGETRCGRYAKKHSLAHFEETKRAEEASITVAQAASGQEAVGHCLVISLSDLSVWCYNCQSYVEHETLTPLVKQMETLKFGRETGAGHSNGSASSSSHMDVEPQAGASMQASMEACHGRHGNPSWASPRVARACDEEARPGYKTKKAHEYLDVEDVLKAKIAALAGLIRRSKNCVAYTGAGISTASGISDYATKASNSVASEGVQKVSHWMAKPTLAHRALVRLHELGHLKHWVQQNHDGLPQKAGFPQEHINEIHGAWYDPSNPVVAMSGTLRTDLMESLLQWEASCDLCLAFGTSMVGMNSDRMAISAAQRAKAGNGLGTVIVALQQTQYDSSASLRIYAPIDRVMEMLAAEMQFDIPQAQAKVPTPVSQPHLYKDLPYTKDGMVSRKESLTLDLRPGARVRLVNQQGWDKERWGEVGEVLPPQDSLREEGHYAIKIGGTEKSPVRVLGLWWLEAAQRGGVPALPVVNC
mmetsp:Transcript_70939/g.132685  ORF Transcript_70939/g.132685 Transcript_70939/m.132685 type:complete len:566 (-) Transcript_70939:169-1866(-)